MADQMCRDVVNKKRERAPSSRDSSDTVTVSFLGAGGQELSVQCPKARVFLLDHFDTGKIWDRYLSFYAQA